MSGCPEKMKVATATAEFLRRWKNTVTLVPKEVIEQISFSKEKSEKQKE